jgi:hypothetical protein
MLISNLQTKNIYFAAVVKAFLQFFHYSCKINNSTIFTPVNTAAASFSSTNVNGEEGQQPEGAGATVEAAMAAAPSDVDAADV